MRKDVEVKIHKIPLHQITPYENNVKIHTVKQLEGLSESIKQFGFKQPIIVDRNNVIVAGHGRYEAAAALGYEELPCVIADDLTDDEIAAYRILDNKLAETGTDLNKLELELSRINFNFKPFRLDFKPVKIDVKSNDGNVPQDNDEFIVLVNCTSEHEQQKIYNEMQERGFECKLIM